jgi:uncharacterized protein (DUF302 family)
MSRTSLNALLILMALTGPLAAHAAGPTPGPIARYVTEGEFENVKDDVLLAIQNKGLVVDNTSHIHDMLERTGKDLGMTKTVFRQAEAYSFCSAVVSRKMMEADPHNIAFCPYVITVYALPDEPNRVYVAYRRPTPIGSDASKRSLKAVEDLLDGIVREALNIK